MKKILKRILVFSILIVLTFFGLYSPFTRAEIAVAPEPDETNNPNIELLPELVPVCACESLGNPNATPTHYDRDGSVLRGRIDNDDIGICQINLRYHQKSAEALGLDVFIEQDNIIYANVLFTEQYYQPWTASQHCWGDHAEWGR